MTAVYDLEFRQLAGGVWCAAGERPDRFEAAVSHGQRLAGAWKGVRVSDGWMVLREWDEKAAIVPVRAEADGHPSGCSCGECACRAAHQRGEHQNHVCDHRVCRRCGRCGDCDTADEDEARGRYLADLVGKLDGHVRTALNELAKASRTLRELTGSAVYDIELAESTDGADALADLDAAARSLRSVRRIAAYRKSLLGD